MKPEDAPRELVVTLTTEQLKELLREAVRETVTQNAPKEVLFLDEVAEMLGFNAQTVMRTLVRERGLPVHYITEKAPRFYRAEVLEWFVNQPKTSKGKAA